MTPNNRETALTKGLGALLRVRKVMVVLPDDAPDDTPVTLQAGDVASILEIAADATELARLATPSPAAQDDPAKRTMTLTLTEREMEALEKVMAAKVLSAPAVFRNSFRLYQAVEMGAASVTFHETGPLGLPATIARQDDPAKGLEVDLIKRLRASTWVTWNDALSEHEVRADPLRAADALEEAERQIAELRSRVAELEGQLVFARNGQRTAEARALAAEAENKGLVSGINRIANRCIRPVSRAEIREMCQALAAKEAGE